MSKFFKKLLGFILLLSTMGLATCQSLVKAEPSVDFSKNDRQLQRGDQ